MTNHLRICALGAGLLLLLGCGPSPAIGERFALREGETTRIEDTGLTITAEEIVEGLDGSQDTSAGSLVLRIELGEQGAERYLETGESVTVGEYRIHFERVVSDLTGASCELLVTR